MNYTLIAIIICGILLILIGTLIIIRIINKRKKKRNIVSEQYESVLNDLNKAEEMKRLDPTKEPNEIIWEIYKSKNPNAVKPESKYSYQEDPNFNMQGKNLVKPAMTDEEFNTYMKMKGLNIPEKSDRLNLKDILIRK